MSVQCGLILAIQILLHLLLVSFKDFKVPVTEMEVNKMASGKGQRKLQILNLKGNTSIYE